MIIKYEVDADDWSAGTEEDRESCEIELGKWFDGLCPKTQVAIFMAQHRHEDDPMFESHDCPWLEMVRSAENRIVSKRIAAWCQQPESGHNLFLHTYASKVPMTLPEREKALLALPEGAGLSDIFEALHGHQHVAKYEIDLRYRSWSTGWADCNFWHMTKGNV